MYPPELALRPALVQLPGRRRLLPWRQLLMASSCTTKVWSWDGTTWSEPRVMPRDSSKVIGRLKRPDRVSGIAALWLTPLGGVVLQLISEARPVASRRRRPAVQATSTAPNADHASAERQRRGWDSNPR